MSVIKQSIAGSFINYVGVLLGAFFTLYLAPKFLSTEYNGLYRLLIEYSVILANYFHFGIPTLINRYFHRVHNENSSTKGFDAFILVVPFFSMIILFILSLLYREEFVSFISSQKDIKLISEYILFLFPLLFANAYLLILEAYFAMLGDVVVVNFFKSIYIKFFNIASILFYTITQNFEITMWIVSIGAISSVFIVFYKLKKLKNGIIDLSFSFDFLKKNGILKDFAKFSGFLLFSNLTVFLVSKIDIFFVGRFTDLSNLAYYTTAMYFVSLLLVPYGIILKISFPIISKAYIENNISSLEKLVKENAIYGFITAMFVFIFIWINIDFIYHLIPKGELYSAGKIVFLILGLSYLVDISIGSTGQLLTVSKWYVYSLYTSIFLSIISITLGYYLTVNYGIIGSAIAIGCSIIVSVIYQLSIVYYKMNIFPYNKNFIIVIITAVACISLSYLIDYLLSGNLWVLFVVKSIIIACFFFAMIYHYNASHDINKIIDFLFEKVKIIK